MFRDVSIQVALGVDRILAYQPFHLHRVVRLANKIVVAQHDHDRPVILQYAGPDRIGSNLFHLAPEGQASVIAIPTRMPAPRAAAINSGKRRCLAVDLCAGSVAVRGLSLRRYSPRGMCSAVTPSAAAEA